MSQSDTWPESDSSEEPHLVRQNSYTIVDHHVLLSRLEIKVSSFGELFGVSGDEALALMTAFQWNGEKLQEEWLKSESTVRVNCGIALPQPSLLSPGGIRLGPVSLSYPQRGACEICYSPLRERDALQCAHTFCRQCWKEYIQQRIQAGRSCVIIPCPQFGCQLIVLESMVKKYTEASEWREYVKLKCSYFVSQEKSLKWCPAPGCTFIAEFPGLGQHDIRCHCGHIYCFVCAEEAHRPAICGLVQEWKAKNSTESESVTWILANTKQCPNCHKPIEKNQGCNHITCNRSILGCGFEFCWLCLGPWGEHNSKTGGYYSCNKYNVDVKVKGSVVSLEESKRSSAKTELDRYMFYFERFENHQKAQRFALKQVLEAEHKMKALHDLKRYDTGEVEFLKEAALQVIECRRVLKYTYIFGYFLEIGPEKNLFEHLQQQLEENTEHLHELVEKDISEFLSPTLKDRLPFLNFKSALANYTSVTQRFLKKLLDGIDAGLTTFV